MSIDNDVHEVPLLPARMVNEYVYCPRLAYLEWVQQEWEDNSDTIEGQHGHRRVNKPGAPLPVAEAAAEVHARIHSRSVGLSSNRLHVTAVIDLVDGRGREVTPVDYKRGRRPHVERGAYDPERVQLCVQGMLLEEHGYECPNGGILYYIASRERVVVAFDEELRALTLSALAGLRVLAGGSIPPPLEDSPKCPRCSLVGICLPDEVRWFGVRGIEPRPLFVARDQALPVYIQAHNARVGKRGGELIIRRDGEPDVTARLQEVSQVVLLGNVGMTTPALHELMARGIPVSWHSHGGWFVGHTHGTGHHNVEVRTAQYAASFDDARCLELARGWVWAKILNGRTLLRRNTRDRAAIDDVVRGLRRDAEHARRAESLEQLRGVEGAAAARYFSVFAAMLRKPEAAGSAFDFTVRNRRPPRDPINALLSFAYALLARAWTVAISGIGLDPYRGFYHQPRWGRPALALDLMESFRPLIADSAVVQAINNAEVRPEHFVHAAGACTLTGDGRKRFIATLERRMAQEITHPWFGYRVDYRRLLELQARLFTRHLLGEIPDYPPFLTR